MPVLRLFAAAREAAGVARAELDGATVGAILTEAEHRYGERFSGVLAHSRVWVNGQPAEADTAVHGHDVIAVLPPVSGGSNIDLPWGVKAAPAEPEAEESPVAVDLTGPVDPPLEAGPPTEADEIVWLDDVDDVQVDEVDEPDWLAAEPTGVHRDAEAEADSYVTSEPALEPALSTDVQIAANEPEPSPPEEQWSGWSSASGSYQGVVVQPDAPRRESRLQPFAPAASAPPASAPSPAPVERPGPPVDPSAQAQNEEANPGRLLEGGFRKMLVRLAVVYDTKGPHGRLGLLWAIVTVGAAAAGAEFLAGWLGLTAFVGAFQASRARLSQGHVVLIGASALMAAALPAAALIDADILAATVGGCAALAFVVAVFFSRGSATRDGVVIFAVGVSLGAAAAGPVFLRVDHIEAAFLLLAYAATYDAGAYLVGTGASSVWEGPVAGVAALIPVVILSAVLLVPPFQSGTPILLGLLAAVLAPLGPLVGSAIVGDGEAHAPGLRRLDSLIVLGPIWSAAALAFIN